MQRLNIILPVLNEERCLEASVRKIKAFLDSQNIPYMLTIADNGSTDNTSTIARALCDTHTQYLKISQKGVGIAFRESILHNAAHEQPCEFVGYMDIDLSTNLAHLKEVYALLLQKSNDGIAEVLKSAEPRDERLWGGARGGLIVLALFGLLACVLLCVVLWRSFSSVKRLSTQWQGLNALIHNLTQGSSTQTENPQAYDTESLSALQADLEALSQEGIRYPDALHAQIPDCHARAKRL